MKSILLLAIGIITCLALLNGCATTPTSGGGKSLEKYYSESVDKIRGQNQAQVDSIDK